MNAFANLKIQRLTKHEIYQRGLDQAVKLPLLADNVFIFDEKSRSTLEERLVTALGDNSYSMEVNYRPLKEAACP
jgi:hypothetical protein